LDRILTLIVNRISNTSYHLQYLYYPGGNETGAKPNLITCITEIFLSADINNTGSVDSYAVWTVHCLNREKFATGEKTTRYYLRAPTRQN
jgi:hypothetical protein